MRTPNIKTNQGYQRSRRKLPEILFKRWRQNKRCHYNNQMLALHLWGCSAHDPARSTRNLKHIQRFFIDAHGNLDKYAY